MKIKAIYDFSILFQPKIKIKIDYPNADFYIVRRGSKNTVGSVTREYSKYHFGVKCNPFYFVPAFMYYQFMNIHLSGHWRNVCNGNLNLKHITINDLMSVNIMIPKGL